MRQTQESFTIYHQYKIKATALAVYDCITQPQHLINWWPLTCTGIPQMGEIYNYNFGPQFNWFAKVIHSFVHLSV